MGSLKPGGKVLDGGAQGLYFLCFSLAGSGESSDLRHECGDVLLHAGKAGWHCSLYLSQNIFQVVVAVV